MKKFEQALGPALCGLSAIAFAAGAAARIYMDRRLLSPDGMLPRGSRAPLALAAGLAAALALAALLASRLEERPAYRENFSNAWGARAVACLCGCVIAACGVLRLRGEEDAVRLVTCALQIAAGALMAVQAVCAAMGKRRQRWMLMPMCVYLALNLIGDYRTWSGEPNVLAYCFALPCDVACMLAAYHLAGFDLDRGKRRMGAFWCAAAVSLAGAGCFGGLSGAGTAEPVLLAGRAAVVIWVAIELAQLCRYRKKEPTQGQVSK